MSYKLFFAAFFGAVFLCSCKHHDEAKLKITFYIELTDSIKSHLPQGYESVCKKAGWTIFPDRLELNVYPADAMLTDKKGKDISGKAGVFSIESVPAAATREKLAPGIENKIISENEVYLEYPKLKVNNLTFNIFYNKKENTISVYKKITHAECCSQKLTGDSTGNDPMDDLRCLDYNGLSADGQNRPRTDPQAAINFINSDCQLALVQGFCWSEHLGAVTGCQKNHNGKICSELINHSTTYHTH